MKPQPTLVIVGDRPSAKNTDPDVAFVGTPSYARLQRILEAAEVIGYTLVNAYDIDGNPLPIPHGIRYVALGKNAAARMKELGILCLELPHPSGRNRIWNDENAEAEAARKLKEYVTVQ